MDDIDNFILTQTITRFTHGLEASQWFKLSLPKQGAIHFEIHFVNTTANPLHLCEQHQQSNVPQTTARFTNRS